MRMKKLFCAMLAASMICAAVPSAFAEKDVCSVMVDNEEVKFDQPPTVVDGRMLVPIRAVFEKAGAEVDWDGATMTATVTRGDTVVSITADKDIIFKNGKAVPLDVPAAIINDRTLIPLRAVSDALDFGVTWNGAQSTALIATNNKPYRAFAMSKRGFRDLPAVSDFYVSGSCVNNEADLNGDGINETVSFTSAADTENSEMPLLVINNTDFSSVIKEEFGSLSALGVVSIDGEGKQIVVVGNGDIKTAHFYTYDGTALTPLGDNTGISFKTRLLFDENKYVISDIHGLCFMDIMITGSFYKLEDGNFKYYKLTDAESFAPRDLTHTYNDNILLKKIVTDKYSKGAYKNAVAYDLVKSEELYKFRLLEMYVDPQDPSYTEFYVQLPDESKAVLTIYHQ